MRWLKSTTQKEWVINGKIIPKCVTKDNDYLTVEDTEYNKMLSAPVFSSLVKAGDILVFSQEPAELQNSIASLNTSNSTLKTQNKELKAELEAVKASVASEVEKQVEAFKKEAIAELQAKQEELDKAKAELKALRKKAKAEE